MHILSSPSPNFGDRRLPTASGRAAPCLILLHYTDMPDARSARLLMQDPNHQASAHFLIDTDGTTEALVPIAARAWHAGKSGWAEERDINSLSIGIELQNTGHRGGKQPYPSAQMEALIALCRYLTETQRIDAEAILGHSDVAPGRKQDPGEHFPWQKLAEAGYGYWPRDDEKDTADIGAPLHLAETAALLTRCGYDPHLETPVRLEAFQRHFVPEAFADKNARLGGGEVSSLTARRLRRCADHAEKRGGCLALPPPERI